MSSERCAEFIEQLRHAIAVKTATALFQSSDIITTKSYYNVLKKAEKSDTQQNSDTITFYSDCNK